MNQLIRKEIEKTFDMVSDRFFTYLRISLNEFFGKWENRFSVKNL